MRNFLNTCTFFYSGRFCPSIRHSLIVCSIHMVVRIIIDSKKSDTCRVRWNGISHFGSEVFLFIVITLVLSLELFRYISLSLGCCIRFVSLVHLRAILLLLLIVNKASTFVLHDFLVLGLITLVNSRVFRFLIFVLIFNFIYLDIMNCLRAFVFSHEALTLLYVDVSFVVRDLVINILILKMVILESFCLDIVFI